MGAAVRALLAALLLATCPAPSFAQGPEPLFAQGAEQAGRPAAEPAGADPRAAVKHIAGLIRSSYFDAAKAARIARELETDAKAGRFDDIADPRDLAHLLSSRLSAEDRHFAVSWAPSGKGAGPRVAAIAAVDSARMNHGFVETAVLPGGVGYLKLDLFAHFDQPGSPQQAAADAALQMVAGTPSLILDLRDNGGGSPNMVGYLVQQFVAEPARVASVFRNRHGMDGFELSPVVSTLPKRLETPLFILVSARTGSSAEALAYTLQAAGRAIVVGEQTGGAANPGSVRQTADGFAIFIPVGTPVNPITGTNWEGVGVTPDIRVAQDEALAVAQIRALEAEGEALPPQARLVLETLKAEAAGAEPDARLAGRYDELQIARSGERLQLLQGRRPARTLVLLADNRFSLAEDPAARFRIERLGGGEVLALVKQLPGGGEVRYQKSVALSSIQP